MASRTSLPVVLALSVVLSSCAAGLKSPAAAPTSVPTDGAVSGGADDEHGHDELPLEAMEQDRLDRLDLLRGADFPASYVARVTWVDVELGVVRANACVEVEDGRLIASEVQGIEYTPDAASTPPVTALPMDGTLEGLRSEALRLEAEGGRLRPTAMVDPDGASYYLLLSEGPAGNVLRSFGLILGDCELS